MKIPLELIKELRSMTFASIANCKSALEEAKGDIQKARDILRKRGLEIAAKRSGHIIKEGRIEAYVHMGSKIGVLVEVVCETDFVSRNSDFAQFAKDIAMQIAALSPDYIKIEDVPQNLIKQEKNKEQFYKEHCLLEQNFVKDSTITIKDYLGSLAAKFNENIFIRRFTRYKIGE
jgi:elongation factor Ts